MTGIFAELGWTDPDRCDEALYALAKRIGEEVLPPGFVDDCEEYVATATPTPDEPLPPLPEVLTLVGISEAEYAALLLVAAGLTNEEIGEALFVMTATVAARLGEIRRKLGAKNRAHAVHLAWRGGLLRR